MKKTGAILLAAGLSSRMGSFKPMLPFGNSSVAIHLITMLKEENINPLVVVTGYRADELEQHLFSMGVRFVKNERYQTTHMFDSIRIGIDAIKEDCEKVMILPVDVPAIMPDTIRQIMMLDAPIIRTVCNGEPGHPVLLQIDTAVKLCAYEGPGGLKGAMEASGIPITNLEVEDEGIYRDMDTEEQYQELLDWNYQRGHGYPTRPKTQIRLEGTEYYFGPGSYELLTWIDKTGSIQDACREMELSYSKGSKMIKTLEKQLGFSVVQRRTGGIGGGGSELTEEGKRLIQKYRLLVTAVQNYSEIKYQEYFGRGL
ncbi:MAG: NTP transferase domain-containing protein [Oliverpabstia sp.]